MRGTGYVVQKLFASDAKMFVTALKSSEEAIIAVEKEKIELNRASLEKNKRKDALEREAHEMERGEKHKLGLEDYSLITEVFKRK